MGVPQNALASAEIQVVKFLIADQPLFIPPPKIPRPLNIPTTPNPCFIGDRVFSLSKTLLFFSSHSPKLRYAIASNFLKPNTQVK
jgi:hypothetical protein